MGEKIIIGLAVISICIVGPYFLTISMNGKYKDTSSELEKISTGKDVLVVIDGKNFLIDAELYIAGVLPGLISPNSSKESIEAQAVAVRTKIYFEMGEKTVIDAANLGFKYYAKKDYDSKWGRGKYYKIKAIYENAVLNTVKKTM